jgi:putative ABC transport system permease protein
VGEGIRIALVSLVRYKLRTFLTVLGNIVAVTSVIAVVSLIDGMDLYVRREIADEGSNELVVSRVDPIRASTDFDYALKTRSFPEITIDDYRAVREADIPFVAGVAASDRATGRVDRQGRGVSEARVSGWTADYPEFTDSELREGRHFNAFEERNSRAVAVIGSEIADTLFRGGSTLGQTVRVNGRHVEVIGVFAEQKKVLGQNPNLRVTVPLGCFMKIFGGRRSIDVRVRGAEIASLDELQGELRSFFRIRRALKPLEDDDFAVVSSEQIIALWEAISKAIFSALILLVSISLVVGGVVIMNIMLVSVTERTREVGTRKALGARRVDILWQFLVESVTLSMIGGILGILLGFGVASLISWKTPLPYAVEPWAIVAALFVTFAVGIFFGIYPANRAARLDPVEALRRE